MGKNIRFGSSKLGVIAVAVGLVKLVSQVVTGIKKSSQSSGKAQNDDHEKTSTKK